MNLARGGEVVDDFGGLKVNIASSAESNAVVWGSKSEVPLVFYPSETD